MKDSSQIVFKHPLFDFRKTEKGERTTGEKCLPHDYYWLSMSSAVMVLAWNEKKELCVCKEWRLPVKGWVLGLPGGKAEEGESFLESAKRELKEEAGLESFEWERVGQMRPFPGMASERIEVWTAFKATSVGDLDLDPSEIIEPFWIDPKNIFQFSQAFAKDEDHPLISLDGILASCLWMFYEKYPEFKSEGAL